MPDYQFATLSTNDTYYETNVTVSCEVGYKYDDDVTAEDMYAVCLSSGLWDRDVPDCIRKCQMLWR